jgi:DNA-binding MarR family transcriptional regulator
LSSQKQTHTEQVSILQQHLRKLSTRMVLFQQNAANSLGVIHTDLKSADILNELGPMTAGELGKITCLSTGTVTALIDRLEQAGYVTREKDPNDRRRVIIVPVEEQEAKIRKVYTPMAQAMSGLCTRYSEEELSLILDFVDQMTMVFEEENRRLTTI